MDRSYYACHAYHACRAWMPAAALALTLAGPLRAAPLLPAPAPAPAAAPAAREGSLRCSGQAAQPGNLSLQLGKSTLMRMPEAVQARSVGNPAVLQAMLVAPDTLYMVGVDIGTSNMIVQGRSGLCKVVEVVVGIDPGGLQQALAALMPEQKNIRVSAAGDTLVLSGEVDDAPTAAHVVELAAAFVRRPAQALDISAKGAGGGAAAPSAPAMPSVPAAQVAPSAPSAPSAQGGARIVNLLTIGAPQQVMLEVKIAEVSKSLLDKLEASVNIGFGGGGWASALTTNFVSGTLKSLLKSGNLAEIG